MTTTDVPDDLRDLAPMPRHTYRFIRAADLVIDPRVQRGEGFNETRVQQMAKNFNPEALGIFIVSERGNGQLVCLDAMHRGEAAKRAGHTDDIFAQVFSGLTLSEEASLFLLYNDKKNVSAVSKFNARVVAGDPIAKGINDVVGELGWVIGTDGAARGCIAAVTAVERVYVSGAGTRKPGAHPALLKQTLNVITRAWGLDTNGVHQTILGGVGQLFGRYERGVDIDKLVREMQADTPRNLIGRANALCDMQGGTKSAALAKVLTGMHNNRKRSGQLPEWIWTR